MKRVLIPIALLTVFAQSLPAIAAFPDPETYSFITKKYNLLLRQGRDGCAYYADPTLVQGDQTAKKLIVLLTNGSGSGTFCQGMFRFDWLDVNCKTNQVAYINAVGSPSSWQVNRNTDAQVAQKVCALPTQNFGTSGSKIRPPAK